MARTTRPLERRPPALSRAFLLAVEKDKQLFSTEGERVFRVLQGVHALLSRAPLLHDLLTAVNACNSDVNATQSRKKLFDLILRPPTKGVMIGGTMTTSSVHHELSLLCVMSIGLPCKVIGLDKEAFRLA